MPENFISENFLLQSEQARRLYHDFAEDMPIIDYHCHLSPQQVSADQRWENITQIWLYEDHYKWRVMRANGVSERYCTGDASDWEKFEAFAATMPYLLRNPIYHWCHLELKRYFDISDVLLCPETARTIYERCNEKIRTPRFSSRSLMKQSNVALVCTIDDPTDDLEHHRTVGEDASFDIRMLPAWRPDKGMAVENAKTFNAWVDRLAAAAGVGIRTFDDYMTAMRKRHDFFGANRCRLSDHGIGAPYAEDYTITQSEGVFSKIRGGGELDVEEVLKFKSAMLYEFALMDHEKDWTQQFHFGVLRNLNTRMFAKAGPDSGFDSTGDFEIALPLSKFLDRLDRTGQLTRTIFYNLNPRDNELLVSMIGNFQDGATPGKIQLGSAWWFLDNIDGMTRGMEALSNSGLLSRFVGMTTDSRSFISYVRHEYFRRLLCNILGGEMGRGLIPDDMELVGKMVEDICYNNAASYFGFDV